MVVEARLGSDDSRPNQDMPDPAYVFQCFNARSPQSAQRLCHPLRIKVTPSPQSRPLRLWNFHPRKAMQLLRQVGPNSSVKGSANGVPPSPGHRYAVHFRWPGLGVTPSSPPYLER